MLGFGGGAQILRPVLDEDAAQGQRPSERRIDDQFSRRLVLDSDQRRWPADVPGVSSRPLYLAKKADDGRFLMRTGLGLPILDAAASSPPRRPSATSCSPLITRLARLSISTSRLGGPVMF
jgi:hypothetical protein